MPAGHSERVGFLRARIAALEASEGAQGRAFYQTLSHQTSLQTGRSAGPQDRVALGKDHHQSCSLDRALQGGLPLGALHEIVAAHVNTRAAASGFACAMAARFAQHTPLSGAKIIWIMETKAARETGQVYGPGLSFYGLDPSHLIVVETRDAQESLWAMEEALKCRSPAAVIGEIWGLAKIYDLAASRRLVLAARKSGTPGLLIAAGFAGTADHLSSGASTRFEIATHASLRMPSAGGRVPLPGQTAWAVRLVKARAGPHGFGFDRDKIHQLTWDPEKACFRDALSLGFSPFSGDRPARPAWSFAALRKSADDTPSPARNLYEDQVGAETRVA